MNDLNSTNALDPSVLIDALNGIALPLRGGATSEEIGFIRHDRTYRIVWDDDYALEQSIENQWSRSIDSSMIIDDFATAAIDEIVGATIEGEVLVTEKAQ